MNNIFHYTSPFGGITLASDGEALTGLWFDGQKRYPHKLVEESTGIELPIFTQTCKWLDNYFSGKEPASTLPISMQTTPFRKAVYDILLTILLFDLKQLSEVQEVYRSNGRVSGLNRRIL